MSYNNYYMRLRVKAVQEFDRMYHVWAGYSDVQKDIAGIAA